MWNKGSSPYSNKGSEALNQDFRAGKVTYYNPDTRIYTVNVDSLGEIQCKQSTNGILRPYATDARIILGKFTGSDWVIISEMPTAASAPAIVADSAEETLARGRGRLTEVSTNQDGQATSYRPIDSAGESDPPVFVGDVLIENSTERAASRSSIRLYSFGDIFAKASSACFVHLNKLRNYAVIQCRNLQICAAGYDLGVTTEYQGELKDRTTVTETYKANPRERAPMATKRAGDLTGGLLTLGFETTFPAGHEHLDLSSNTKRVQIGDSHLILGDLGTSTTGGTVDLPKSVSGRGFTVQSPKSNITVLEDSGDIFLGTNDEQTKVVVTDSSIEIVRGGQSFKLSDEGLVMDVTNLEIKVAGSTSIDTTGVLDLKGSIININ